MKSSTPMKLINLTLITLIALGSTFMFSACSEKAQEKVSSEDHASTLHSLFEAYPDVITERGDAKYAENLKKAMGFYGEQKYAEAIPLFDELINSYPANDSINFYAGISYLGAGEAEEAAVRLRGIIAEEGSNFGAPAKWYLGLAYIELKDKKTAGEIFTELAQGESSYKEKAGKVLDNLPEIQTVDRALNPTDVVDLAKETFMTDEEGFEYYMPMNLGDNQELSIRATQNNEQLLIRYNKLFTAASYVDLYNEAGERVYNDENHSIRAGKELEINLQPFPAGTYKLQVRLDNNVMVKQRMLLYGSM